jgi:homoserine O-acetyltransferase
MHSAWGDLHQFDFLIGPGQALDTDKYFIVATDKLGNAAIRKDITTGPTNSGLKMDFPHYTIRDEINVDYKLLKEYLGFDHILAVIGASIGGMKAYQFGVSYPDFCEGLVPIAGTPASNPMTRSVVNSFMHILESGGGWYGGKYETNPIWSVQAMQWNWILWVYTPEWFVKNLNTEEAYQGWRSLWRDILNFYPQDARDMYYTHLSWANYNVGDTPGFNGDAEAALKSIKVPVLIIGAKVDMLFDREENIFAKKAIAHATYIEIDTSWGHITAVGWDPKGREVLDKEIGKFLSDLASRDK